MPKEGGTPAYSQRALFPFPHRPALLHPIAPLFLSLLVPLSFFSSLAGIAHCRPTPRRQPCSFLHRSRGIAESRQKRGRTILFSSSNSVFRARVTRATFITLFRSLYGDRRKRIMRSRGARSRYVRGAHGPRVARHLIYHRRVCNSFTRIAAKKWNDCV